MHWCSAIFDYYTSSFLDMTYLVDTATDEERAEIVKGDVLTKKYAAEHRDLLFSQLRNGGYRLAALFNEIFKF